MFSYILHSMAMHSFCRVRGISLVNAVISFCFSAWICHAGYFIISDGYHASRLWVTSLVVKRTTLSQTECHQCWLTQPAGVFLLGTKVICVCSSFLLGQRNYKCLSYWGKLNVLLEVLTYAFLAWCLLTYRNIPERVKRSAWCGSVLCFWWYVQINCSQAVFTNKLMSSTLKSM